MNAPDHPFADLRINPDWAKLPLFDRSGWKTMQFGEFAESINDRVEPSDAANEHYVGLEHLNSDSLHLRRWGKGSDVTGTKLRFRKGDIIFGRRRAYQRKLAVAEFDGICSAHAMVVRAKPGAVLAEFLPFLMTSDRFMSRAVEISVGSLSPTINWKTLKLEAFDLPPLDWQGRIANLLSRIEHLSACLDALMEDIALAKLATRAQELSGSTKTFALEEVCEHIVDCPHTTPRFVESGVLVIRNFNIKSGALHLSKKFFTTEEEWNERVSRLIPQEGDVLFSREAPAGEAALVPAGVRLSLGQRTMLLRVDRSRLLPKYLLHLIYAPQIQQAIGNLTAGTTVPHLNVRDVRSLRIPIPSIDEQERFLENLDSSVNAGTDVYAVLQNVRRLRAQLLDRICV